MHSMAARVAAQRGQGSNAIRGQETGCIGLALLLAVERSSALRINGSPARYCGDARARNHRQ